MNCWPKPADRPADQPKPGSCDLSTAVLSADGRFVTFATDKTAKESVASGDPTSIFTVQLGAVLKERSVDASPAVSKTLNHAQKIEGSAILANGDRLFITAFDRIDPNSNKLDSYNVLSAAPRGNLGNAYIMNSSTRGAPETGQVESSMSIRGWISKAVGQPHFKVEGLAANGKTLYMGIRETGQDFKTAKPTIQILAATLEVNSSGQLQLANDVRSVYHFDLNARDGQGRRRSGLPFDLGLSSLEFVPGRNSGDGRFIFAATYEFEEQKNNQKIKRVGTYFLSLSLSDLQAGKPPQIITGNEDLPIHTPGRKYEAILLDPAGKGKRFILFTDQDGEVVDGLQKHQTQSAELTLS